MLFNKVDKISEIHSFFNYPLTSHASDPIYAEKENMWKEKFKLQSKNGLLLFENTFFDSLKHSDKIYVAHVTKNLKDINESRSIYPSAGCLVGSIYCVPVTKEEDGRLRVHNLGKYIYENELKFSDSGNEVSIILFELNIEDQLRNLMGIDYLKLGALHLSLYEELKYLLSEDEIDFLEKKITKNIRKSSVFLDYVTSVYSENSKLDPACFFALLGDSVKNIPILGYIYFETIAEYLMLFSDDSQTKSLAEKGEFNNYLYKNLLYDLLPELKGGFNLSKFNIPINEISAYINKKRLISDFDTSQFERAIAERMIFLFVSRTINLQENCNWKNILWDFDDLKKGAAALIGHMIHRELRSFGRYPDFYYYFDQIKALQVWNYWNNSKVIIPFNGCFPKGEIGINPAFPFLKYKAYSTLLKPEGDFLFIDRLNEIDLKIIPRLIDLRFTTLRNKSV